MTPIEKLEALGYQLSTPARPAANYVPVVQTGPLLFVSGQISSGPDGLIAGHLGRDLTVAEGQGAAAHCAVHILSQLAATDGVALEKLRIVKLTVLVSSTPDFVEHHVVANGASDLLVEVLGDNGRHSRAAFGVAALPMGAAVEIEAVVEVLS